MLQLYIEYRDGVPVAYRYGEEWVAMQLHMEGGYETPTEAIKAWFKEQPPVKLYTVYNKRTDELVAFELPKERCAYLMGVKPSTFDRAKSNYKHGKDGKWEIFEVDQNESSVYEM